MLRRFALIGVLALLSTLAIGVPANAATVLLSALGVSTPGHVTGSVSTDAAWVKLDLLYAGTDVILTDPLDSQLLPATGPVEFDFAAWGLSSVKVRATACDTQVSCTAVSATSGAVAPGKLFPTVSVSDEVLGPDEPDTQVSVSDPGGGGVLRASWATESYWLDVPGPTALPLGLEGQRNLVVERCWSQSQPLLCNSRVRVQLTVNRLAQGTADPPDTVADQDPDTIDAVVPFFGLDPLPAGTAVTIDWELLDEDDRAPVGVSGTATVETDAAGQIVVPMDFTGAPEYGYVIGGTISYVDPSVGATLTGPLQQFKTFSIFHHYYVQKERTFTVKARQFTRKWVARCSLVSKRTTHGFKGGLALKSGAQCGRHGWRNNGIELTYRLKLPALGYLDSAQLKAYGASAKTARRSIAKVSFIDGSDGGSSGFGKIGSRAGWHHGGNLYDVPAGAAVIWKVRVAAGDRYELRNFRVHASWTAIAD